MNDDCRCETRTQQDDRHERATRTRPAQTAAPMTRAKLGRKTLGQLRTTWRPPRTACSAVRRSWRTTASGPRAKSTTIAATPNLPLMHDLLPVLDNIERAIAAADKTQDVAVLLEGMKLVARQFEEVFARHHCMRIGALHLPFDPHLHHAISQQASERVPAEYGGDRGPAGLSIARPRRAAQPSDRFPGGGRRGNSGHRVAFQEKGRCSMRLEPKSAVAEWGTIASPTTVSN